MKSKNMPGGRHRGVRCKHQRLVGTCFVCKKVQDEKMKEPVVNHDPLFKPMASPGEKI